MPFEPLTFNNPDELTGSKKDAVAQASTQKLRAFAEFDKARQANAAGLTAYVHSNDDRNAKAWAKDNEVNTAAGTIKNGLSAFYTGYEHLAGMVMSSPVNANIAANLSSVTDEQKEAYHYSNYYKKAKTDIAAARLRLSAAGFPEDVAALRLKKLDEYEAGLTPPSAEMEALLDRPSTSAYTGGNNTIPGLQANIPTARSTLAEAEKLIGLSERITDVYKNNVEGIYNGSFGRDQFHDDLGNTWSANKESLVDAAQAVKTGDYLNAGAKGTMALTQLAAGALGDAITNPAGVADYVVENLPQLMAAGAKWGLALTNIGYSADIFQKGVSDYQEANDGALPSGSKVREILAWSAAAGIAEQVGEATVLKNLLPGSKTRNAKKVADELVETVDTTTKSIMAQAVKDTGKAAASSYAVEGLTEGFQTIAEAKASSKGIDGEEVFKAAAIGAASGAAISSPGAVVQGATNVVADAQQKFATKLEEQKAEDAARAEMDAKYTTAVESGDFTKIPAEGQDNYDPVRSATAFQQRNDQENVTDEEKVQNRQTVQELVNKKQDEVVALYQKQKELEPGSEEFKSTITKMKAEQQTMNALKTINDAIKKDIDSAPVEEALATKQVTPEVAERVFGSVRQGDVSVTEAKQLVQKSGFTPVQKARLQEIVDVDAAVQKVMSEVNSDIITGGAGFLGLNDHVERIQGAINNGIDPKPMLATYENFAEGHQAKAAVIKDAFDTVTAGKPLSPEQRDNLTKYNNKGKPLNIHTGSNKSGFVDNVVNEAKALQLSFNQMKGLVEDTAPVNPEVVEPTSQKDPLPTTNNKENKTTGTENAEVEKAISEAEAENSTKAEEAPVRRTTGSVLLDTLVAANPDSAVAKKINEGLDKGNVLPPHLVKRGIAALREYAGESVVQEEVEDKTELVDPTYDGQYNLGEWIAARLRKAEAVEGQSFKDRFFRSNLIAEWFTARGVKDNDASGNALQDNMNLFAHLEGTDYALIKEYLGGEITDAQRANLDKMVQHNTKMTAIIEDLFSERKPSEAEIARGDVRDFKHQDMVQFLTEEDGTLNKDIISAINMATYNWLATQASETKFNDEDDIRGILGLKEGDALNLNAAYDLLAEAGNTKHNVTEALGKAIRQTIGLTAKQEASGNLQANLELSLGSLAIASLVDAEIVRVNHIDRAALAELAGNDTTESGDVSTAMFFRVVTGKDPEVSDALVMHPDAEAIVVANTEVDGMLDKLFKIQSGVLPVEFTAPTSDNVVTKWKGTSQKVSQAVRDILHKHQNRPLKVKTKLASNFEFLSPERQMIVGGSVDVDSLHEVNRKGAQAKNNSLHKEITSFETLRKRIAAYNDGLEGETPFYLLHEIWSNLRIGVRNGDINPQAHKMQRHLTSYVEHFHMVDTTSPEQMRQFKLAVAYSMGFDGKSDEVALAGYDELTNNPVFWKAIDALNAVKPEINEVDNQWVEQLQEDIVAGVKLGKENMWSMDGLQAFADYDAALSAGETEFETSLGIEVDGKTNGPAIGLIQLAAGQRWEELAKKLNKTGVFFDGVTTDVTQWEKLRGNLDAYKEIAVIWEAERKNKYYDSVEVDQKRMDAVSSIFGTLVDANTGDVSKDGRNLSKNPLIVTIYGAGDGSVKKGIGINLVSALYEKIEKAVKDNDVVALQGIQDAINTIASSTGKGKGGIEFDFTGDIKENLKKVIDPKAEKNIIRFVENTYGETMVSAIDAYYSDFKKSRVVMNQSMETVATIFKHMYDHAKQERFNELVAEGTMVEGITTLPAAEVATIEKRLQAAMPIVHTLFSQKTGNIEEGLQTNKKINERRYEPQYKQEQKYSRKLNGTDSKSMTTYSGESVWGEVGVRATVMMIHSLDATTMLKLLDKIAGLNVHDAYIFSQLATLSGSSVFNEGFAETMEAMSLTDEVANTLQRVIRELEGYVQDTGADYLIDDVEAALLDSANFNKEGVPDRPINLKQARRAINTLARETLPNKNMITSNVTSWGQYAIPGGHYATGTKPNPSITARQTAEAAAEAVISVAQGTKRLDKAIAAQETGAAELQKNMARKKLDPHILLSSEHEIDSDRFDQDLAIEIGQEDMVTTFDRMGLEGTVQETPVHQEYLRDLVSTVSMKVEPFRLLERNSKGSETIGMVSGQDMYIQHQINGTAPVISSVLANGIRMSSQEVFAHETVHLVTRNLLDESGIVQNEIKKLFRRAKQYIPVEAFMNDPGMKSTEVGYQAEYDAAEIRWKHAFEYHTDRVETVKSLLPGATHERALSNVLHEFVALGLTNENFKKALNEMDRTIPAEPWMKGDTVFEKLTHAWSKLVDLMTARLTNTSKMKADEKLNTLVRDMLDLNHRKKNSVLEYASQGTVLAARTLNYGFAGIKTGMNKLTSSNLVKNSRIKVVRVAGGAVRMATDNAPSPFKKTMDDMTGKLAGSKYGYFRKLIDEMKGLTEGNSTLWDLNRLSNKDIDQARKHVGDSVKRTILGTYLTDLTQEAKNAVTKAMIKTDLVSLLSRHDNDEGYTNDQIRNFLISDSIRNAEIMNIKQNLRALYPADAEFYINGAVALGHHMATGVTLEAHLLLNAHNIAFKAGAVDRNKFRDPAKQEQAEAAMILIDRMATLEALSSTDKAHRTNLANLWDAEFTADGSHNGITATLGMHQELKEDALQKLFQGRDTLMVKGYTKEIVNPRTAMKVADASKEQELMRQGYVRSAQPVPRDPADPQAATPMYIYVSKDGGMQQYQAGIAGLSSNRAKGTNAIDIHEQLGSDNAVSAGAIDTSLMRQSRVQDIAQMNQRRNLPARKAKTQNFMVPVIALDGSVKGYRYMMTEQMKDTVLEKDNSFDSILGGMAASIVDKEATPIVNEKLVKALRTQFKKDFATQSGQYVEIGPRSSDEHLRELWLMMPHEMKAVARKEFGRDHILIRNDLVDIAFGQRKYTVAEMFNKQEEERNAFEKTLVSFFESGVFGNKYKIAHRLAVGESVLKEIVKILKDVIVVKTGVVTAANILSNNAFLKMLGVPFLDIVKYQAEALKGALEYQKDRQEMEDLQLKIKLNHSPQTLKKDQERIAELKNNIALNPVTELVEAGVMQSIVEDLEQEDQFSYKSKLSEKTEKYTNLLHPMVKTVGKNMVITHDTKLYKVMNDAVRMSDFVARYALHKHYTTRTENPLTADESVRKVVHLFINYDIPTHRMNQYANDIGILWFSKYTLRVQRIIVETVKDNPAESLLVLLMEQLTGDISTIMDGLLGVTKSPLSPLDNPISQMSAVGDIWTLEAARNMNPL